jgi:hypothetical protein
LRVSIISALSCGSIKDLHSNLFETKSTEMPVLRLLCSLPVH